MPRVRFEDEGDEPVEFDVGFGSNLYRAALGRSLSLFNGPMKLLNCWGKGYCGACFVEVVRGGETLPERSARERRKLGRAPESVRLACQLAVKGDLVIRKPAGVLRPRLRARRRAEPVGDTAGEPGS
ncbi:MAG: 2Fe-2S iron-sulfur cluster-binding protein [Gemmatimonadota bacterium]